MIAKAETVASLARRSGKSVSTMRRIIRALEQKHGETLLVVSPGLKRNLRVDMAALERCLTPHRNDEPTTKRKRRRRGDPLPGQRSLF